MENGKTTAFPTPRPINELSPNSGLTKREYFAVLAMQGILSNPYDGSRENFPLAKGTASFAIECADELLKQLEKK